MEICINKYIHVKLCLQVYPTLQKVVEDTDLFLHFGSLYDKVFPHHALNTKKNALQGIFNGISDGIRSPDWDKEKALKRLKEVMGVVQRKVNIQKVYSLHLDCVFSNFVEGCYDSDLFCSGNFREAWQTRVSGGSLLA